MYDVYNQQCHNLWAPQAYFNRFQHWHGSNHLVSGVSVFLFIVYAKWYSGIYVKFRRFCLLQLEGASDVRSRVPPQQFFYSSNPLSLYNNHHWNFYILLLLSMAILLKNSTADYYFNYYKIVGVVYSQYSICIIIIIIYERRNLHIYSDIIIYYNYCKKVAQNYYKKKIISIPCKGVGLVVDFKTTFILSTNLVY